MSIYGQFCPISKSVEVLGERWTLLVIRELLMGSSRFSELQRGLAKISPSLLTKRLKELEDAKLVIRSKLNGQKGYEYHLSPAGKELEPLVIELAKWGFKWVTDNLTEKELDVELLMLDIHRNIKAELLPASKSVIKFHFSDQDTLRDWWVVIEAKSVDLCTENPGLEPDIYLTCETRSLTQIWLGELSWRRAIADSHIAALGNKPLIETLSSWFGSSDISNFNPRREQN